MKRFFAFLSFCLVTSMSLGGHYFTENKGQVLNSGLLPDPGILFYCDKDNSRIFFTRTAIYIASASDEGNKRKLTRFEIELEGMDDEVIVEGQSQKPFLYNFNLPHFTGTGIKSYSSLLYLNKKSGLRFHAWFDEQNALRMEYSTNADPGGLKILSPLSVLPWSTFIGGTDADDVQGVDHDPSGNVIVCGYSQSIDFPVSTNCMQDTTRGLYDAVISKFDQDGNLVWSTYYGSTSNDFGNKIAAGNDHSVYIIGHTTGTDLPVSSGCFQNANAGSYDAFLIKLNSSGSRIWSSYFGGTAGDLGLTIALDQNQNIFFGGSTTSLTFPVSVGAWQSVNNGPMECYIAKFDSAGNRIWCTFYGGSGTEDIHAVASDNQGNCIAIGGTYSTDFPVSTGCYQNGNAGGKDLFILKLDPSGSRIFATYCGGSSYEDGLGVIADAAGFIFITGTTASFDYPVTTGCYQASNGGGDDMFIMKFSGNGAQAWTTYFGGSGMENNYGIASSGNDSYIILCSTTSTNLPIIGPAPFNSLQGVSDAYLVKFNTYGIPAWSTYYGGSQTDVPHAISMDAQQRTAFGGVTSSVDYPVTFGAFQISWNGNDDGFVTQLDGSFDNTTGMDEHPSNAVTLFPNPVSGNSFTIGNPANLSIIHIYDVSGRLVKKERLERSSLRNESIIDISNLQPGFYSVVLSSEFQTITTMFSKIH